MHDHHIVSAVTPPQTAVRRISPIKFSGFGPSNKPKASLELNRGWFVAGYRGIEPRASHIDVIRPIAAFARDPGDVLGGVLHVAGLAVDAVLGVDLEAHALALRHHLIDQSRTIG